MDDFFCDDLSTILPTKRVKNSNRKGKRGERELVDILNRRFPGALFSRVVGSGNRWSQVQLSEQAKLVLTGDLCCPPGFRFSIEAKFGYDDIDLFACLRSGNRGLDEFLKQAEDDAGRLGRNPLLCWKRPRLHWVCFLKEEMTASISFHYRGWQAVSIDHLLGLPDSFFFNSDRSESP